MVKKIATYAIAYLSKLKLLMVTVLHSVDGINVSALGQVRSRSSWLTSRGNADGRCCLRHWDTVQPKCCRNQNANALLPENPISSANSPMDRSLSRSWRTLHRHLQVQSTTFTQLIQLVRSEFVVRQLRDSDRSMGELAELIGFSGSSAFAFWFRQRFGCTVSQWRKQHLPSRIDPEGLLRT